MRSALRVKAIGLNRAEVIFRMCRYLVTPELPSKLGYEASGTVEAIGSGVDPTWLGKTASTVPAFPANTYGVYGEVAIVPATALAEYPANLSYEEGTSIWMQYMTPTARSSCTAFLMPCNPSERGYCAWRRSSW